MKILVLMPGHPIVQMLSQYEWAKFLLFANVDLSQYVNAFQQLGEQY
ncbi:MULTISPECIES: hypothetical protein [Paenibacillus]|uniref:Uncharacterized protein n=1 Tax=Paenibacillus residui TaxID=629724 RepID=A0ABW3DB06_9BACL|nr:hypothetical protein [Paenibacillus sp. 32O-W]